MYFQFSIGLNYGMAGTNGLRNFSCFSNEFAQIQLLTFALNLCASFSFKNLLKCISKSTLQEISNYFVTLLDGKSYFERIG